MGLVRWLGIQMGLDMAMWQKIEVGNGHAHFFPNHKSIKWTEHEAEQGTGPGVKVGVRLRMGLRMELRMDLQMQPGMGLEMRLEKRLERKLEIGLYMG